MSNVVTISVLVIRKKINSAMFMQNSLKRPLISSDPGSITVAHPFNSGANGGCAPLSEFVF